MIHFDKPYCQTHFNPVLRCAVHRWKSFCYSYEYRQALNDCLELVSQTAAISLIIDARSETSFEESWHDDWVRSEWLPRVLQTNLRKMAVIVSKEYLAALPQPTIQLTVADQWITGRFFDNPDEASQWIRYYF